jgi:hypothetical protein
MGAAAEDGDTDTVIVDADAGDRGATVVQPGPL